MRRTIIDPLSRYQRHASDPDQSAGERRGGRFHVDRSAGALGQRLRRSGGGFDAVAANSHWRLQPTDGVVRLSDFDVWRAAMTRSAEMHAVDARLAGAYVRRFDLALRA